MNKFHKWQSALHKLNQLILLSMPYLVQHYHITIANALEISKLIHIKSLSQDQIIYIHHFMQNVMTSQSIRKWFHNHTTVS